MRTTGFRLGALYAGLFGLSVIVLFVVIYWITSNALRQQLAVAIEADASALVEDYQTGGLAHVAGAIEQRLTSDLHPMESYLLLDSAGGKIAGNLARITPRNGWQGLPVSGKGVDGEAGDDREKDGEHGLLALGLRLPDESFLLVAEDLHRVDEVEEAIVGAFGWAFAVTVLLAILGGGVLSIGFLRRVDAINRTSRAIIEGRLTDRVPTRGTGDELDRLAVNLNEMLDRIQALMESLREVSSDIAHDLRTPLSRLRQRLEGARREAQDVDDYASAVDQAIADTDAILKTFAALLRIAQIEAGTRKLAFSRIDLSGVFRTIGEVYGAVAEDRAQTLETTIEPGIEFPGDRELLTQMLANLVENAIRHAPEGACIEIALKSGANGPIGWLSDNGPGIPPALREKVFQRFFRLDRSRSTAGSGLGLALVAAVTKLHDIAITLADNEPGLRVVLEFAPSSSP